MDTFEEIVMSYLVRNGQEFVCPQFNLKTIIDGKSWSCCPDFVAINPSRKIVSVVEVSIGSNTKGLAEKTNNWCGKWGEILTKDLTDKRIIDETWNPLQVRIFIRKDQTDGFVKRISSPDRIKIETIEDIWCRWSPKWWDEKLTLADSECGEIK